MFICTQVYVDGDAHTDTQVHKNGLFIHLAQTWTHKLSLRQRQSTAAWSVRGGSAAGDYQCGESERLH